MTSAAIATVGATMTSFISEHSMTGYPLIDTLIIANIIPIVISYVNQMTAFISWFLAWSMTWLGTTIRDYIRWRVRTYTIGTELIELIVTQEDYLYTLLNDLLKDKNVVSDCYDFYELSTDKIKLELTRDIKTYNIDIHNNREVKLAERVGESDVKYKSFACKGYIVRIIKGDIIKVHLVGKTIRPYEEYERIVLDFLEERVKTAKFPYVYVVRYDIHSTYLYNLVSGASIQNEPFNNIHFQQQQSAAKKDTRNIFRMKIDSNKISIKDTDFAQYITCNSGDIENACVFNMQDIRNKFKITNRYELRAHHLVSKFGVIYYVTQERDCNSNYYCTLYLISNTPLDADGISGKVNELITDIITKQRLTPGTEKKSMNLYKRNAGSWQKHVIEPRSFENIYLAQDVFKSVRKELNDFINKEKLYRAFQIPYKKGILLYGPPGTGKTTLVKCLSYEYQIPIYTIDVNDNEINDESIVTLMDEVGKVNGTKILLFEDIDSAFASKEVLSHNERERKFKFGNMRYSDWAYSYYGDDFMGISSETSEEQDEHNPDDVKEADGKDGEKKPKKKRMPAVQNTKKYLTYSGLLNALDGVLSNQVGVITIMTTNYLEKLGNALIRPGRIDKKFELRECDRYQIKHMARGYIKKAREIDPEYYENITIDDKPVPLTDEYIRESSRKFADVLTGENGFARNFIRPCELQTYLLKYIDNLPAMFANYDELLQIKVDVNVPATTIEIKP